jgi:hypothetical protein
MNGVGFLGRQNGRGSGGGFNGNHGRPLGGGNNVAMGAEVVNGLGKKIGTPKVSEVTDKHEILTINLIQSIIYHAYMYKQSNLL